MKARLLRTVGIVSVLLSVISCDKENTAISSDSVLTFKVSDNILPADGKSSVILEAGIDPESTIRTIKFVTTLGTFMNNGIIKRDTTASVLSDGTVKLRLYAGKTAGVATVQAKINDEKYTVSQDIRLISTTEYYPQESLSVSLSDTAIAATPAQTFCQITSILKEGPALSEMTFQTTSGSFLGTIGDSGKTIVLSTDLNGKATVRLLSSIEAGTVFLTIHCDHSTVDTTIRFIVGK